MAANRQMKRMMQRQGQVDAEGAPVARKESQRTQNRPAPRPTKERVGPAEFTRQVRAELRKVAWPTRAEVINYSIVVFMALVLLTGLIFGLDYLFGKLVIVLFK
ncbi:MAG: preprotein translocase subunit SecE [Acidimicrobiales bacterium]